MFHIRINRNRVSFDHQLRLSCMYDVFIIFKASKKLFLKLLKNIKETFCKNWFHVTEGIFNEIFLFF